MDANLYLMFRIIGFECVLNGSERIDFTVANDNKCFIRSSHFLQGHMDFAVAAGPDFSHFSRANMW